MRTHTGKSHKNKNQSPNNAAANLHRGRVSTFQLVDNRSEPVKQRKLQEIANNSIQTKQISQLRAIADNNNVSVIQPMLICYTREDLGHQDAQMEFDHKTIGLVRFQRRSSMSYNKSDGDNTGSIKHYVPYQWISKNLVDYHMEGKKRWEVINRLSVISGDLGLALPTIDWKANVASFNTWVETAFDNICDWEENLYRHSVSTGDHGGNQLDVPADPAVKVRVERAETLLNKFGLAVKNLS